MRGVGQNRVVAVVVLASFLVCVYASVAHAAGMFTWRASFAEEIRSRNYETPNTGRHTIVSTIHRGNDPTSHRTYTVELYRDIRWAPDVRHRDVYSFVTGLRQTASWVVWDTGTFYFVLDKPDNGFTWSGTGSMSYW